VEGKRRTRRIVEHHPLVQALNPDPAQPPQRSIVLTGLPGPSPAAGETRLWLDAGLTSYVDVPDESILHSQTLPNEGGTVLWVAVDAKLSFGSVTSHATQAEFLAGDVASGRLAGAAAEAAVPSMGIRPTPPWSIWPPCQSHAWPCGTHTWPCPVSLPFCPSEAMAPSHCAPCVSLAAHCMTIQLCPSLPFCASEAMAPSHCAPCVSQPRVCPPPSAPCPSVHTICPTPSAVGRCGQGGGFGGMAGT
jgi:hypothetical protein